MTNWSSEIAAAVRELRAYVDRKVAQVFSYTLVSKQSAIGDNDSLEGCDEGQDPGAPASAPKSQKTTVRVQPFGFNGVPPNKVRGLVLRLGSSNLFFIGIGPTKGYGPQSLNTGESAMYNAVAGCQQVLDQSGNVKVNSGTPSGGSQGDVVVNGGTLQVARKTDKVTTDTTMATWISSVSTFINGLSPGAVTPPTDFGVINGGAAHFKA